MNVLPGTPAGIKLGQLVQLLGSPKRITPEAVTELFHPSFVSAIGSADALTTVLKSWADDFVPFELQVVEAYSGEHTVAAEVTSSKRPAVLLTCTVQGDNEAHLITGLLSRPKPREIASLDEVDDLLAYHGAAGLSAAVVVDGDIAWARAWGVTDSSAPSPLTPRTLFQAASISKPVAALAALRLADQGVVGLDTDVNEMLTSWRLPAVKGWEPVVTIRNLLTHTAALTVHGFPGYEPSEPIPSLIDVLDGSGNTPAVRSVGLPGLVYQYSGGGYSVLQQLMTDVTGEAFPDLLRDLVLEPLGMNDSTFEQPLPTAWEERAASGHVGGEPIGGRWHIYPELAAAGLWTTPSDLARFVLGVVAAHSGQPGAVLSKPVATQMLSGQAVAPARGLGPGLREAGVVRIFDHNGQNAGFLGNVVSTYDGSFGLIALTNSDVGYAAIFDLFRFLVDEHGLPELLPETPVGPAADGGNREHGEPEAVTVGDYETEHGLPLYIEAADDKISVRLEGQNSLSLNRASDGQWVSSEVDVRAEFRQGQLRLHQLGQTVEASKLR